MEAALGGLAGLALLFGASALHLSLSGSSASVASLADQAMFWPLAAAPLVIGALGWLVGLRRQERDEAFLLYQHATEEQIRGLAESEWVTRAVVQNAFDAVLILSPEGEILDANPTAARVFGMALTDLVGLSVDDLLPERTDLDNKSEVVERRTAGGESLGREWRTRARHADGSRFPVDLHISLLADAGLVVYAIREASTRVGEQERRVREAVDAYKDRTGSQRRKRGTLLLDLGDHLRDELEHTLQAASALAEVDGTTQSDDLSRVVAAAHRMLDHLEQLHNLSMWEQGARYPMIRPVKMGPLVEGVVNHLQPLAARNGNRLTVRVADEVDTLQSDGPKLVTVVRNLVGNACRFTTDGEVSVEVGHEKGRGTDWVAVYVHDTGRGMAPEDLDALYVQFARASRAGVSGLGPAPDGGMGLALAQRLARSLSGHIAVESVQGTGSTFSLRVPLDPTKVTQIPEESPHPMETPTRAPSDA